MRYRRNNSQRKPRHSHIRLVTIEGANGTQNNVINAIYIPTGGGLPIAELFGYPDQEQGKAVT